MSMNRLGLIIISTVLLTSCGEDKESKKNNFDREPILVNLTDNLIVPAYTDLVATTEALNGAVESFVKDRSSDNLIKLKTSWKQARLSWKRAEIFKFGPIETKFLHTKMDIFPVSTSTITSAIEGYDGSDNYLVGIGSTAKGFGTIEYLLFETEAGAVLSAFENTNRQGYLKAVSANLNEIAVSIMKDWKDEYAETFKKNTGNDVGASITLFTNALIEHIEVIKNFKIATPLGVRTSSEPLVQLVESPQAKISGELITENLNALKKAFKGGEGQGLDDYLDELNAGGEKQLLSASIVQKIDQCIGLVNDMGTLSDAISQKDVKVNELLVALQELTTLTKSDMMSQLGLIITFSSNDGD